MNRQISGVLALLATVLVICASGAVKADPFGEFAFQSTQTWDCRLGSQGGMGPSRSGALTPGWYYNNDWGRAVLTGLPPIRACMARDGSGWLFDVRAHRQRGALRYYHSPTLLFGHKGWGFAGNRHARRIGFPVRAGDIASLRVRGDFTFDIARRGMMNTHLSLWFVPGGGSTAQAWRKAPFFEMMLKITNDRPVDSCRRRGVRGGRFAFKGNRLRFCYRSAQAFVHDHNSWEANLPGARRAISGRHQVDLPLDDLVDHALEQGWLTPSDILLGVEFQTEIASGAARLHIDRMQVELLRH